MTRRAPCSRKSLALAKPIPLLPPVISAVLPVSCCIISIVSCVPGLMSCVSDLPLISPTQSSEPQFHGRDFLPVNAHVQHSWTRMAQDRVQVQIFEVLRGMNHMTRDAHG